MSRQATQAFRATRAARFADIERRERKTEFVVVTRDEEFFDGDRVLGGTEEAVMVEREIV